MSALRLSSPGQPTRYIDLGPQSARAIGKPYSAVHASPVGQMSPVLTPGGLSTDWHGPKRTAMTVVSRRIRDELEPQPRAVCGVIMRNVGEPCARRPGHCGGNGGGHRSKEAMEHDALVRRTAYRGTDS